MTEEKRFLFFATSTYYPSGGMGDLVNSFDTIEEAQAAFDKSKSDIKAIFDCAERVIVIERYR